MDGKVNGKKKKWNEKRKALRSEELQFRNRPVGRCPGCGVLVKMPCVECGIEAQKIRTTHRPRPTQGMLLDTFGSI